MPLTIAEAYPELFHYTNLIGLEGILRSQTIWAAHPAFMNDSSELTIFRELLPGILTPVVADGIDALVKISKKNEASIAEHGGRDRVVDEVTVGIIVGAYRALLGGDGVEPFIEPYIASFCTFKDERASKHGLLSQWRGYGQEGGYAIGFATSGLDRLMQEEALRWKHTYIFGGDAIYSDSRDEDIRSEFWKEIDDLKNGFQRWFSSGLKDIRPLEDTYPAIVKCACRFKHWGFREEREVRYIVIPPNKDVVRTAISQGEEVREWPRHHYLRGGVSVPCIHLFEGITNCSEKQLPITRIVVGPSRDGVDRKRAVEMLLREVRADVEVTVSEIPYVGHT